VGRQNHVVQFEQQRMHVRLVLEDVQAGAGDHVGGQGLGQADSSTTGPRLVFIKMALGFIWRSSAGPISLRVESLSGTCSVTKSASPSSRA